MSGRTWLASLNAALTDYAEPVLMAGCAEEAARAMLDFAVNHPTDWDGIVLTNIGECSPVVAAAAGVVRESGDVGLNALTSGECPIVRLPASFDEFLLRHRQGRRLMRSLRQADRAGITIDVADSALGSELGNVFLHLHLARFPTSPFRDPNAASFARHVLPELWRDNHVLALVAKHRGRPIGIHLYMRSACELGAYNGGFDPEYDRFGVGTMLFVAAFRRAIDEGLASVNLFRGCASYKMRWATNVERLCSFGIEAASRNPIAADTLQADFPPPF